MKKLLLGLALAIATNVAVAEIISQVAISDFKYDLDTEAKTATITGYEGFPRVLDVEAVEYEGESYIVTKVGPRAFYYIDFLTEVSLPSVLEVGEYAFCYSPAVSISLPKVMTIGFKAFENCRELKTIWVNKAMKAELDGNRSDYGIESGCNILSNMIIVDCRPAEHSATKVYEDGVENTGDPIEVWSNATVDVVFTADAGYCFSDHTLVQTNTVQATVNPIVVEGPAVVEIPLLDRDQVAQAQYVVQEPVVETNVQVTVSTLVKVDPSVTLKSGDTVLKKEDYEYACDFYGIQKAVEPSVPEIPVAPTTGDFRVVPKNIQVVGDGEVAVKQTELQAAKAEAVTVENGVVTLGVNVCSNANFAAETKTWAPVEIKSENVEVKDGKIVISVPVTDKSGFMILQSGDAKIAPAE